MPFVGGWVPPFVRFVVLQRKIWTIFSSLAPTRERSGLKPCTIGRSLAPGFSTSPGTSLTGGERPGQLSLDTINSSLTAFLPPFVGNYGWNGIGASSTIDSYPAPFVHQEPSIVLRSGAQCSKRRVVSLCWVQSTGRGLAPQLLGLATILVPPLFSVFRVRSLLIAVPSSLSQGGKWSTT